ncbi:MAG: hypothetical protein U9R44_04070, partial [Candidatus Omnitrophota bacterium]|nr:hypothetical protein [Candidatus Omnitrophota bacterium]
ITDLLSEENLGFTISEFENFVTVPITEAYSSLVTGVTDSMSLTMDVHLYENALNQIWAASVTGDVDPSFVSNDWSLDLTNAEGHSITLTGDRWSGNEWHALVDGFMPVENVDLTGEAAGTYSPDGVVEGVAGGTWSTGDGK